MHDQDPQHMNADLSEAFEDHHSVTEPINTRPLNAAKSSNKGTVIPGDISRVLSKSSTVVCKDKSIHNPGGKQQIKTLARYIIPLTIKDGLTRLYIRSHTDQEYDTFPHLFLTSDPSILTTCLMNLITIVTVLVFTVSCI